VVENDANAAALAEFWFGCARDVSNFMYLKTDTGVGAGIVCERALMTGARGMAGEIGHVPLVQNGHECVCGQHGCLETYLYGQSLLRRYESRAGTHLDGVRDFLACAAAGDPVALSMVSEAAGVIGTAAAMAATLLDLDLVVIGGLWGELGASLVQPVQAKAVEILDRSGLDRAFAVRGSALGEDSDVLGAAGTVINRWFTPPI
jgi:predicted NBD/HSP70 family sugar kinase